MDVLYGLLVVIAVICVLLTLYVWYMSMRHGEIRRLGFDGPKPRLVLGNITGEGMAAMQMRLYNEFKTKKVIGIYLGRWPALVVQDLDLIREIFVKKFHCFLNHGPRASTGTYLDYILPRLRDDHWKHVRSMISPTFSTVKLKLMSKHIESSSQTLLDNLKEKMERNEPVELKNTMSCFAMDVSAATGFGIEINSIKDPENQFVKAAKKLMSLGQEMIIGLFFPFIFIFMAMFGISMTDKTAVNSFTNLITQAMQSRSEESGHDQSQRKDFLQLLVNARHDHVTEHDGTSKEEQEALKTDGSRKGLTDPEIYAQGMVFLLAGYVPLSAGLSFTSFLLAVHPKILKKVQEELDKKLNGAKPNYDNVQNLTYMDMCINEALRMYPQGITIDRFCGEEVEVQGITFPKGYQVLTPAYAIHHDPDIWPDPFTFDPERFTPENKAARHPYAHMPFGHGPRNCIGMRLALLMIKITLAVILQELSPVVCEKTVYPVKLQKVRMEAVDGLWVRWEKRT